MTDTSLSDERRAFSYWLRTGRRLRISAASVIETKFNPWHDPSNGQFTFASSGTRSAYRGGGGSFGGGGASGRGAGPKVARPVLKTLPAPKGAHPPTITPARPPAPPVVRAAPGPTEEFRRESRNGYEFQIDSQGKTRRASGPLSMGVQPRDRRAQLAAGGADRRPTDDGGHYVATRFNGPPDSFNLFPQDSNFNRSTYKRLEEQWAKEKRAGNQVKIDIRPIYETGSKRPTHLDVIFTVNGRQESLKIPNEKSKVTK